MLTALPFAAPFLPNGSRIQLGEGPLVFQNALYSIDALGGILRKTSLTNGATENVDLRSLLVTQGFLDASGPAQTIGCVSPTKSGRLLLALTAGLYFFDPATQRLTYLAHPNQESATMGGRYNDGKPGPDGALYVGGMSPNPSEGGGRLFRVAPDGSVSEPISGLPPLSFPNGLHWNPTDNPDVWLLYYVDSTYPAIQVYRHHLRKVWFERLPDLVVIPPEEMGFPDGMTGTKNGLLILALFSPAPSPGEEKVFGPVIVDIASGERLERVSVPVPQATSVALDGSTLYVTTGAEGYSAQDAKRYPAAGSIFTAHLNESQDAKVAQALGMAPLTFDDLPS